MPTEDHKEQGSQAISEPKMAEVSSRPRRGPTALSPRQRWGSSSSSRSSSPIEEEEVLSDSDEDDAVAEQFDFAEDGRPGDDRHTGEREHINHDQIKSMSRASLFAMFADRLKELNEEMLEQLDALEKERKSIHTELEKRRATTAAEGLELENQVEAFAQLFKNHK